MEAKVKYWINTVSRDHLQRGIDGGFTQANHGKAVGLKRLRAGDGIIFYSPKTAFVDGEPLQAFTALGHVRDDELYQAGDMGDFVPWRRNVDFEVVHDAPIRPLLDSLAFIKDKSHWGYAFRFGLFEISEGDFHLIKQAMQA